MPMIRSILMLFAGCGLLLNAEGTMRTFRYGFTVENPTQRVVERAELWTYAPIEHTAYQECLSLSSSHPYELETDPFGNRILHFTFAQLAPFQQIKVRVEASLEMREEPRSTPGDDQVGYVTGPLFDLEAEQLDQVAPPFTTEDPRQCAAQIYRWASTHIEYSGYQAPDRGAGFALMQRQGDCTEYAALMAAACRRHQIPVRGLAGFVYDRSAWLKPRDLHNWTEIMLDGHWWIADPLKQRFLTQGDEYVALYRMGEVENAMHGFARFRFEGDGLRVRMDKQKP